MNINESASNYVNEKVINNEINEQVIENNPSSGGNPIINFFKSKTGTGSIESYNEHPLNFKNNHFLSQVIRGLTGLLGSLDLAIVDIIIGGIGYFKKVEDV
jgi:uncharacterized Fe-S center protein